MFLAKGRGNRKLRKLDKDGRTVALLDRKRRKFGLKFDDWVKYDGKLARLGTVRSDGQVKLDFLNGKTPNGKKTFHRKKDLN